MPPLESDSSGCQRHFAAGGFGSGLRCYPEPEDMAAQGIDSSLSEGAEGRPVGPVDAAAVLGAVREDIRQTLRTGWVDPALEAGAAHPVFFTAAWSAVRPNVGKSFLALAKALRTEAVGAVHAFPRVPDLRKSLVKSLTEEELRRIEESTRAAHLAMAKAQIVVHAIHRALRRDRIPGTGREESPIRRGVPDWQRWMSAQPASEEARPILDEAIRGFQLPFEPTPLRLLARWPLALGSLWEDLKPAWTAPEWNVASKRLRRVVLAGISSLPHPVELQWAALRSRGFGEHERASLEETFAAHDWAMPSQTLLAAYAWVAFGGPEIGSEG